MGIGLDKPAHIIFFVVFLPALSIGVGYGFSLLFPALPFWVETLSPLGAYGLFYRLFDNYCWHWRLFRILGIVTAPDFRGRWLGKQLSSFQDSNGKQRTSRVVMEVEQTFSRVHVSTYYKNWTTDHTISSFVAVDNQCILFVMFETTPRVHYNGGALAHKGVMRLTQTPNKAITGSYFNAEGRQGELHFARISHELSRSFN